MGNWKFGVGTAKLAPFVSRAWRHHLGLCPHPLLHSPRLPRQSIFPLGVRTNNCSTANTPEQDWFCSGDGRIPLGSSDRRYTGPPGLAPHPVHLLRESGEWWTYKRVLTRCQETPKPMTDITLVLHYYHRRLWVLEL